LFGSARAAPSKREGNTWRKSFPGRGKGNVFTSQEGEGEGHRALLKEAEMAYWRVSAYLKRLIAKGGNSSRRAPAPRGGKKGGHARVVEKKLESLAGEDVYQASISPLEKGDSKREDQRVIRRELSLKPPSVHSSFERSGEEERKTAERCREGKDV